MRRRVLPESSEEFRRLGAHLERSGAVWSRYRLKSEQKVRKARRVELKVSTYFLMQFHH